MCVATKPVCTWNRQDYKIPVMYILSYTLCECCQGYHLRQVIIEVWHHIVIHNTNISNYMMGVSLLCFHHLFYTEGIHKKGIGELL